MEMKRKLVIGLSLLTLAVAIIGSGVIYAYFSSTQTASNNQFTTGSITLTLNNGVAAQITANNLVPSDTIYTAAAGWPMTSAGTLDGNLNIGVGAVTHTPAGSDLGASLRIAFWVDADSNNAWSSGDVFLGPGGMTWAYNASNAATLVSGVPQASYNTLDSYAGVNWPSVKANIAPGSSIGTFRAVYNLPYNTPNAVQGASDRFDLTFTLQQSQAS